MSFSSINEAFNTTGDSDTALFSNDSNNMGTDINHIRESHRHNHTNSNYSHINNNLNNNQREHKMSSVVGSDLSLTNHSFGDDYVYNNNEHGHAHEQHYFNPHVVEQPKRDSKQLYNIPTSDIGTNNIKSNGEDYNLRNYLESNKDFHKHHKQDKHHKCTNCTKIKKLIQYMKYKEKKNERLNRKLRYKYLSLLKKRETGPKFNIKDIAILILIIIIILLFVDIVRK
jgi:hypothetical protein